MHASVLLVVLVVLRFATGQTEGGDRRRELLSSYERLLGPGRVFGLAAFPLKERRYMTLFEEFWREQ